MINLFTHGSSRPFGQLCRNGQLWHQLPNWVYLSKRTSLHRTRVTSNLLY